MSEAPTPRAHTGHRVTAAARPVWLLAWAGASLAALTGLVEVDAAPGWLSRAGAATLTVLFAVALTRRSGGRVWFWSLLSVLPVAAALATDQRWLLSSVAVLVAVLGGITAVMLTRPAAGTARLVLEYLLALVGAASAGLAVAAWDAPLDLVRYPVVVLALTLAVAIALVWQLGAGYHGLGRRGLALIAGGAVLVTVLLVYSRVLREYGSVSVTEGIDDAVIWTADRLGGVPRPVEALVGFPALLWGIRVRSSRRQGWWMCAFGTLGTAALATSLANPAVDLEYAGLSTAYSIVLGLLLGLLVIRVDALVTRSHRSEAGRRALRERHEPEPVRPESGRTAPLR